MKTNLTPAWLLVFVWWFAISFQLSAQEVTMGSLLKEMTDRESMARYPEVEFKTKQFSSYDRRARVKGGEHWFANSDRTNFLRAEETVRGTEWVMFDSERPGAIVRWWMTFAGEGSGEGTLRIYIDGSDEPVVEGVAFDVMSGGFLAGRPLSASLSKTTVHRRRGHNLYLPIPYNSCKITYQDPGIEVNEEGEILESSVAVYYNINYREYVEGTMVEPYGSRSPEKYLPEINRTQIALNDPYSDIYREPAAHTMTLRKLAPGERMEMQVEGEKYIRALSLKLDAEYLPQALRSTVISLYFDGSRTLTVPAGDFFGTGYEIHPYETYYTRVFNDGTMAAFWPMPFQREVRLVITNHGDQVVSLEDIRIRTGDWSWDDRSMYFGGTWKQFYDKQTGGGDDPEDLNFVTLEGMGVYAGDLITLYNDAAAWWGEGDEKIYVDGEEFPSHFGTGTEDYYGYAWSRPEFFDHPFIAQPDGSGNLDRGTAVNIRFRALDKIPFRTRLDMDMELWHWRQTSIDYAPATFFYLKPGGKALQEFDPQQATRAVRFAAPEDRSDPVMANYSIQGEKMEPFRIDRGEVLPRYYANWDWEEDTHMVWRNAQPGDVLLLRFRSPEAAGDALLELQLTQSGNYGKVALSVNGSEEVLFDGYAPEIRVERIELEEIGIRKGWNTLRIEIRGKNPEATAHVFGIDYLKVK